MARYSVLDEYDNGWKAVRGSKEFYTQTPSGKEIGFGNSAKNQYRRRVRMFTALCVKYGEIPRLDNPDVVPTDVAIGGKTEITAYLLAVHWEHFIPEVGLRPTDITDRLGVSYDTVRVYERRVIRSVEDRKIGGTAR